MPYDAADEDDNFELVDYTSASPWEKFVASIENQLCKLEVSDGKLGSFAIDELSDKCRRLLVKHRQYRSAVLGQVSALCTRAALLSYRGSAYSLTLSVHPLLAASTTVAGRLSADKLALFDSHFPATHIAELEVDHSQSELEPAWHPLHRWTGSSVILYMQYLGDDGGWVDDDDGGGGEAEGAQELGGNYSVSLETAKILISSINIAAQNVRCQLPIFVPVGDAWRCLFTGRSFGRAVLSSSNGDSDSNRVVAIARKIETLCLPNSPSAYLQLNGLLELYTNSFRILESAPLPSDEQGSSGGLTAATESKLAWDFISSAVNLAALHTYRIKNTYSREWNSSSPDFLCRAGDLNVGPVNDPLRLLVLSALFQRAPCGTYIDMQSLGRDRLYLKTATAWVLSASMFPADRERTMLTEALEDAFAAWAQLANRDNRHRHLNLSEQMEAHAEVTGDMLIDLFGTSKLQHIVPPGLGTDSVDVEAATKLESQLEQTFSDVYASDDAQHRPPSVAQLVARMPLGAAVPHNSLLWRLSEIILVTTAKRSAEFWRAPSIMTFLRLLWAMTLKEIRWRWENEQFLPRILSSAECSASREGPRSGSETPKSSVATSQATNDTAGIPSTRFGVHLQFALVYQKLELLNCCLERKLIRGGGTAASIHTGTNASLVVSESDKPSCRSMLDSSVLQVGSDGDGLAQRIRTHVKDQICKHIGEAGVDIGQRAWTQGSRIRRPIGRLLNSMRSQDERSSSARSHSSTQSIAADMDEFEEIKAEDSFDSDSDGFVSAEDVNRDEEKGENSGYTSSAGLSLPGPSNASDAVLANPTSSLPVSIRLPANATRRQPDFKEMCAEKPASEHSAGEMNFIDVAISSSMDSASGFHHVSDVYEREDPSHTSDGCDTAAPPLSEQSPPVLPQPGAGTCQVNCEKSDCFSGSSERLGGLYPSETLKLLESDEPVWIPKIQLPPVLTEDMLREREAILMGFGTSNEGAQQRAQLQCADLISDMESFKAANPGCALADFVRWHSPRDWIVPDGASARDGSLSVRMASGGEGNLWQRLWAAARCVPADNQKLLFDFEMEAEKALHYLEGIPAYSLFASLLPVVFAIAYERLYKQPIVHRVAILRERLAGLGKKIAQQVDWTSVDPENPVFSSMMDDLEDLEVQTSRCVSLLHKFPEQYALVQALVSEGQALIDDRNVQKVVLKALSRFSILTAAPSRREYVLSSNLLGLEPATSATSAVPGVAARDPAMQQRMYVAIEDDKSIRVVYAITMSLLRKGVIAITGTTGVGKSQLAIDLARALNGEVINADALQVYKGYDIITNKVTREEMLGVSHHLLGFVESNKEYTVQEFEQDALRKISEIHQRDRIPILVGGTNYYIQSVLFRKSLISSSSRGDDKPDALAPEEASTRVFEQRYSAKSNQELWEELRVADPVMAENWHANNRRKVLRSLEVLEITGKRHSEWIRESEAARESEEVLRFPTLLFWLYADAPVLNQRLDSRVDKMIERGMFDELDQLAKDLSDSTALVGSSDNFTVGLKQAIGFREFKPYLAASSASTSDSPALNLDSLKQQGVEDMKTSTRRYAKRQIGWIRNKLLPECNATLAKSVKAYPYVLDATDLTTWDASVGTLGVSIAKQFFAGEQYLPDAAATSNVAAQLLSEVKEKPNSVIAWKRHLCRVCSKSAEETRSGVAYDVWLNGDDEYTQHIHSRQHRKNVRYRKQLAAYGGTFPSSNARPQRNNGGSDDSSGDGASSAGSGS
ncbi:tRNA dimethylallyltransferase, mitochondrial [Coemansia sp. RSA 2322]|nr:tRNA dimethylallyltransferase, mitochondrial [Coemansia sp. RSA 2322]